MSEQSIFSLSGFRRMQLMRQAEAAECGLACLGMVASAHGHKTDLPTLRRRFPVSLKGARLKHIIQMAGQLGLSARTLRCEPEELANIHAPAILHWNLDHYVVLKSVRKDRYVIYDPARGKVTLNPGEVSDHFTGFALELTPASDFQRRKQTKPLKLTSLVKLDSGAWRALGLGLALSLFLQIFMLMGPYYMQLVIDEAITKGALGLLGAIALGFGLIGLFEALSSVLRGLTFQLLANRLAFTMETKLFHHMARLPMPYFYARHVGDIQQRFQSLLPIKDMVAHSAVAALIDGVLAVFLGIVLFLYDALLGLVVCGFILVFAALRLGFLELSKRLSGDLLVAEAKKSTKFLETLRAMQTVKVSGMEAERESLFANLVANYMNAQVRLGNVNIGYGALSQLLMVTSNVLIIYLAASKAIGGAMTIGMITAFIAYKNQFEQKLMALIEQYAMFKLLDVHLMRVSDIALARKEPGLMVPQRDQAIKGRVDLENVSFRYAPFEPEILKGVELCIEPGESVAIAAPSGTGKSTLLKILLGLYPPGEGKIYYDGIELTKWNLTELRSQIGSVMQDDRLLAGSIEENISLFDERPDRPRIVDAARIACMHADIEAMPMGYRSLVGDMGTSLSGGQQQRIILARALYRRPRILIMDEATNALDLATEQRVNAGLKQLSITRIVATHRADTLAMADKVYALQDGQLRQVEFKLKPVKPKSDDSQHQ